MSQYKFTVNGQSVVGTPNWNPNGSLGSLAITDPFNSANAQTCTYSHDDLSRIASDSCTGSAGWSQTFSYDPFGNISKSGTQSFLPTYSSSTNHMTLIGSNTPTYDANGNVTNDFLNSYTWGANGRPVTVNGVGVTYDALGRMAEQNSSGVYSQIVYSPTGFKMQILSGGSYVKEFLPMPGGTAEVWPATGPRAYYRHSDWLGSSRLASTNTRTVYYDGAYGPFGEPYAQSGTSDSSFTGMNQDTSPNVYDFPAREYAIQGRWPSPDPLGSDAADSTDPQSWNLYSYVRNSPLFLVDPFGFDPCPPDSPPGAICVTSIGPPPPSPCDDLPCGIDGGDGGGGGGGGGGGNPPTPTPPKNRVCSVSPASALQYAAATAQVAAMTAEFFSGLGPADLTFGPNSATSQVMAQSGPVQEVLNEYYMTGAPNGLYTFGLTGLHSAGENPVAQFVGSFRWAITPADGGINLSLTNTTSFKSLTYDKGPQWQRGFSFTLGPVQGTLPTPMGNTHQVFNIFVRCQ